MAILFGILKVIGILLLSLLCLVLLLVLIVLFVPIRYRAEGVWHPDERRLDAGVTWLFHLLNVSFNLKYESGLKTGLSIRILGRTIGAGKKQKRKEQAAKSGKRKKRIQKLKKENPEQYKKLTAEAEEQKKISEAGKQENPVKSEKTMTSKKTMTPEKSVVPEKTDRKSASKSGTKTSVSETETSEVSEGEEREQKPFFMITLIKKAAALLLSIVGKIGFILNHAWEIPGRIVNAVVKVVDKAAGVCGKISAWVGFLRDEEVTHTIRELKRTLFLLLRHIGPKKAKGTVTFGLEDPSQTGMILAAASVFFPVYGNKVTLSPNFEEQVLDGELEMKGRIRLGYLVYLGLRLILDREVRGSYHKFKKVKEETQHG
ncbi:MAG: hypothetical protein Q4B15_00210 [Lachnospiraceae bacterium]|nr:hypothetical protein [Lachnospiraceae bacterium]